MGMKYEMNPFSTNISIGNVTLTLEEMMRMLNYTSHTSMETGDILGNAMTIFAYSIIILVSFLGNVLVCRVCLIRENRTTTNWLIASLAASDLLVTVFNIPFNVARLLLDEWPFGQFICFLIPFVQVMAVYVSSFTMAVISIHRWRTVTSTRMRTLCSSRVLCITIFSTWALSAAMSIPHSVFNRTVVFVSYKPIIRCRVVYPRSDIDIPLLLTLECFLTQYVMPLSLACCIYAKIGQVIAHQGLMANARGKSDTAIKRRTDRKRRRIFMLVLVVAVFAICWLPINVYHLLADFKIIDLNYKIFLICHWFAMSSVCYNPFIYCWLNSTFRNEAKRFFLCLMHCGINRHDHIQGDRENIRLRRRSSLDTCNDNEFTVTTFTPTASASASNSTNKRISSFTPTCEDEDGDAVRSFPDVDDVKVAEDVI